jgi:hypothetical protein
MPQSGVQRGGRLGACSKPDPAVDRCTPIETCLAAMAFKCCAEGPPARQDNHAGVLTCATPPLPALLPQVPCTAAAAGGGGPGRGAASGCGGSLQRAGGFASLRAHCVYGGRQARLWLMRLRASRLLAHCSSSTELIGMWQPPCAASCRANAACQGCGSAPAAWS